jgi:hypothetical protein
MEELEESLSPANCIVVRGIQREKEEVGTDIQP